MTRSYDKPADFTPGVRALETRDLNALKESIPRQITGTDPISVQGYGDRIALSVEDDFTRLIDNVVLPMLVVSEGYDYLVCRPFTFSQYAQVYQAVIANVVGSLSGSDVYVAKPWILQRAPWDGKTVVQGADTITFTYTGVNTRDAAISGGATLAQHIDTPYFVGDIILAKQGPTGLYYGSPADKVWWTDINFAARRWYSPPSFSPGGSVTMVSGSNQTFQSGSTLTQNLGSTFTYNGGSVYGSTYTASYNTSAVVTVNGTFNFSSGVLIIPTSPAGSPVTGSIYLSTTTGVPSFYYGGAYVPFAVGIARETFSNANKTLTNTVQDQIVTQTGTLTAARTVTFPTATRTNQLIYVVDESNTASATNTISVVGSGGQQINGSASAQLSVNSGRGAALYEFNGTDWFQINLGTSSTSTPTPSGAEYYTQTGTTYDRWYAAGDFVATTVGTASFTAALLYLIPFVASRGGTLDRIAVRCAASAASAKARIGIYDNASATDLTPGSLVIDAGEVDCSTTGVKSLTISQALTPGNLYWFAVLFNTQAGAGCTFGSIIPTAMRPVLGWGNDLGGTTAVCGTGWKPSQAYGVLPSTAPAVASGDIIATTLANPAIFFRYSA